VIFVILEESIDALGSPRTISSLPLDTRGKVQVDLTDTNSSDARDGWLTKSLGRFQQGLARDATQMRKKVTQARIILQLQATSGQAALHGLPRGDKPQ